jgi:hypothetical protein
VRTTRNTQIHSVGRMLSVNVLKQVVHILTARLNRIRHDPLMHDGYYLNHLFSHLKSLLYFPQCICGLRSEILAVSKILKFVCKELAAIFLWGGAEYLNVIWINFWLLKITHGTHRL